MKWLGVLWVPLNGNVTYCRFPSILLGCRSKLAILIKIPGRKDSMKRSLSVKCLAQGSPQVFSLVRHSGRMPDQWVEGQRVKLARTCNYVHWVKNAFPLTCDCVLGPCELHQAFWKTERLPQGTIYRVFPVERWWVPSTCCSATGATGRIVSHSCSVILLKKWFRYVSLYWQLFNIDKFSICDFLLRAAGECFHSFFEFPSPRVFL